MTLYNNNYARVKVHKKKGDSITLINIGTKEEVVDECTRDFLELKGNEFYAKQRCKELGITIITMEIYENK